MSDGKETGAEAQVRTDAAAPRRARRRVSRRDFGGIIEEGTPSAPSFCVRWYEGRKRRRKRGFRTRSEAGAFLAQVRVQRENNPDEQAAVAVDVTVQTAIESYDKHRREEGNKPGALADTTYRLITFFPDRTLLLADLTPSKCASYYEALRNRVSRTGRPYAVDSHRNMLAEAKSLLKWCVTKRWLRRNPLDVVEGKGKRRHGKPQLRIDEARRWLAKALELAEAGDGGAVAAMMALLLGMRASEIVSRVVRDLDDGGRLIWIPDSKTEAGKRTLRVPELLQPYLLRLAAGRQPEDLLFGEHWRDWPREWVQRICQAAGVPSVTAHGMRGLHSTLAMEAGVTGAVVAASLGHESVSTTIESYAKPDAVAAAQQARALTVLTGSKVAAR